MIDDVFNGEFKTFLLTKDSLLTKFLVSLEEIEDKPYLKVRDVGRLHETLERYMYDDMGENIATAYGSMVDWDLFQANPVEFVEILFSEYDDCADLAKIKILNIDDVSQKSLKDREGYYLVFNNECICASLYYLDIAGIYELVEPKELDYEKLEITFSKVWINNQDGELRPYACISDISYDGVDLHNVREGQYIEESENIVTVQLYYVDSEGNMETIFDEEIINKHDI